MVPRIRTRRAEDDECDAFLPSGVDEERPKRAPRVWRWRWVRWSRPAVPTNRTIVLGEPGRYPPNVVRNQKYNLVTFLPLVLYEQFKFFFNLYFLLVALSQFIPALKIGFLVTYIAPLSFVLLVTISKEALDDYERHQRDAESNSSPYEVLVHRAPLDVEAPVPATLPSSRLQAGHLVVLHKNQRVPADMVLLKTYTADADDTS